MERLKTHHNSSLAKDDSVAESFVLADLSLSQVGFDFIFRIEGVSEEVLCSKSRFELSHGGAGCRQEGLWNHTCFEIFLKPSFLSDLYYEFNFSTEGAWDVFEFESYRKPEALKKSADFELMRLKWEPVLKELSGSVLILKKDLLDQVCIQRTACFGLTAVVEDVSLGKSYWALAHSAEKADFHLSDSFVLKR